MPLFPHYKIKGSPQEIGVECGRTLRDRIIACYEFYRELIAAQFDADISQESGLKSFEADMERRALAFAADIQRELPGCAAEIEATASGAGLPPWKLYFLNARTELACTAIVTKQWPKRPSGECTAAIVPQQRLLAQTWDWHPRLEELAVVLELERPDGHRMIFLAEPGIIGKWGLNSAGVGVLLTILFRDREYGGIPVHVLLRVILECASVPEARRKLESLTRATTSSLTMLDAAGNSAMLELDGSKIIELEHAAGEVHTNHYAAEIEDAIKAVPGSVARLQTARRLLNEAAREGEIGLKRLLSDTSDSVQPICRSYGPGAYFTVGTVSGVVMNVEKRSFEIIRGRPAADGEWVKTILR